MCMYVLVVKEGNSKNTTNFMRSSKIPIKKNYKDVNVKLTRSDSKTEIFV